ncbi:dephospho-CoA kinase [Kaistia sp. 32K]|uniref:dephospho-CoA kinase n=1 Tax=Kaistia sp. 32K TaxID=2795690 RepID=UPI001915CACE|nr:dephospho-CoA kinase [Kaistia sp. 32K]BCP55796.1 dephospho-CoA kinase [Kaistia sp. 32K]
MIVIGVTGSIGMGKSTTARLFAEHGAVLHDADAVVHALYRGPAVPAISARFPDAIQDGVVDRGRLSAILAADPGALRELEAIVHPMVQAVEAECMAEARRAGRSMFVVDVPLLFETGGEKRVDVTVVVSAPAEIQAARVLERPGMTPERLAAILARQMPDAEKRRRAHFVVETGGSKEASAARVADIVRALAATAAARSDQN